MAFKFTAWDFRAARMVLLTLAIASGKSASRLVRLSPPKVRSSQQGGAKSVSVTCRSAGLFSRLRGIV